MGAFHKFKGVRLAWVFEGVILSLKSNGYLEAVYDGFQGCMKLTRVFQEAQGI